MARFQTQNVPSNTNQAVHDTVPKQTDRRDNGGRLNVGRDSDLVVRTVKLSPRYSATAPSTTSSWQSSPKSSRSLSESSVKENKFSKIQWPTPTWKVGGVAFGGLSFIGASTLVGFAVGGPVGAVIAGGGSAAITGLVGLVAYAVKKLNAPSTICRMADQAVSKHIKNPDSFKNLGRAERATEQRKFVLCRDAVESAAKEWKSQIADSHYQGLSQDDLPESINSFAKQLGDNLECSKLIGDGHSWDSLGETTRYDRSLVDELKEFATQEPLDRLAEKCIRSQLQSTIGASAADQRLFRSLQGALNVATANWVTNCESQDDTTPTLAQQYRYMQRCAENLAEKYDWRIAWSEFAKDPNRAEIAFMINAMPKLEDLKTVANEIPEIESDAGDGHFSKSASSAGTIRVLRGSSDSDSALTEPEDDSIRNAPISRQNNVAQLKINVDVPATNNSTQAANAPLKSKTAEVTDDEAKHAADKFKIVIDSPKIVAHQTDRAPQVEEPQKKGDTAKSVATKTSVDLNANVAPAHQRSASSLSKADMFFLGDDDDFGVHAANESKAQEIKSHVGQQLKKSPLLQSASDGCRVAVGNFAGQVARQVATNVINSDLRNPMRRRGTFNMDTVTRAADRALKETLQALKDINGLKSVKVSQEKVEALKQHAVSNVEALMWKKDPLHCSADVKARCAKLAQLPTPEEVARSISLYTIANAIHKDGLKETVIPAEHFSNRRREIVNQVVLDADAYMHRMYQTWEENDIEKTVASLNQTLVPAMNRTPMQWLADGTDKMELLDEKLYD